MLLDFYKYHGAGNDFIMVDARNLDVSEFTADNIKALCDRHFGIGADGLILLTNTDDADFRMIYFNADGKEGTMCGNGGRCITAFAEYLGIIRYKAVFSGIDGLHEAHIGKNGIYSLKMTNVDTITQMPDGDFINTGSDHFVIYTDELANLDVFASGRKIRYEDRFGDQGTNVNFIQLEGRNEFSIRTYERGVENETLACGTGAVASAISAYLAKDTDKTSFKIHARGGDLEVRYQVSGNNQFSDIWLTGPAEFVFSGTVSDINKIRKQLI